MALETGSFISDLVSTNPVTTDPISQGQGHLTLLKSILKTTFPGLNGATSGTPWQFNAATGLFSTTASATRVNLQAQTLVSANRGGGLRFTNGASSTTLFDAYTDTNVWGVYATLVSSGAVTGSATMDAAGNVAISGNLSVASGKKLQENGASLVPAGVIVMWNSLIAPSGWTILTALQDRFPVGAGVSFTLAASGGAVSYSGSTSADGAHTPAGTLATGGAHSHGAATGAYSLALADLPSHTHGITDTGHYHYMGLANPAVSYAFSGAGGYAELNISGGGAYGNGNNTTVSTTGITVNAAGSGTAHSHAITADTGHTHVFSGTAVGTHSHTVTVATLPPYFVVTFIQKL